MKGKQKSVVVTVGNVKLPIYSTPHGARERFTLAWREAGVRKRKVFDDFAAAKEFAGEIGVKLENGQQNALSLSTTDHQSYALAMQELSPLGIPLHSAISEFIAARNALPEGVPLLTAVEEYAARHSAKRARKTVAQAVREFIESKQRDRLNADYVKQLEQSLNRFASAFPADIGAVKTADVQKWIRQQGGAPKTQNHLRSDLVSLGNFARDHLRALPTGPTEFSRVGLLREIEKEIGILSRDDMTTLLTKATAVGAEETVLWLSFGGFAGLRPNEAMRLHWSEIDLARSYIRIEGGKSKTGSKRLVPIQPNLKSWLAPLIQKKGAVFTKNANERAQFFAWRAGISIPFNGLRHSYGTYRVAVTSDTAKVAHEMGNSPGIIMKHYDRVRLSEEGQEWFAISQKR